MVSRPPKKKTKRSLTRSFVVTVAVGVPGALLVGTGCGTAAPEAGGTGRGIAPQGPGVVSGKCADEGAQQPCHLSLGKSADGKILSCFSGTQTCTGGFWSGCGGEGTVTNSVAGPGLNLAPAGVSKGGLHVLAGIAVSCGDNTCSAKKCMGGGDGGRSCASSADCAGAKPCIPAEDCASCPQDCGVCPPGAPGSGVVVCTADPCNPDCKGWTNTPGISSTGGSGSTIIGVSGFGQINNGMLQKLALDSCQTGTACDNFTTGSDRPQPSSYYNCQMDTTCALSALGGDGCCHQFPAGGVQGTGPSDLGTNAGVDITIGPGCSDTESDKYRYFPICNRGNTSVPVGTIIRVKYFNPNEPFNSCRDNTCTPLAGYDCSMKVGDAVSKNGSTATAGLPLAPGTCQLLDTEQLGMAPGPSNCSQPNGDKWIFANCDGRTIANGGLGTGVAEGPLSMKVGIPPIGVTGPPLSEPTTVPGILGCANNMTDHASNNNPPSCGVAGVNVVTVSSDYHAICPVGFGVVWNHLIYDTTTPKNTSGTSEVFFEAATAKDVAGVPGPFSSFFEMGEAQANNAGAAYVINGATLGRDPEKCSYTLPLVPPYAWPTCTNVGPGPAPPCCPKDIEAQLVRSVLNAPFPGADPIPGALLAKNDWLRLQITIKATPDNKKDATLNSWSISYKCVAQE